MQKTKTFTKEELQKRYQYMQLVKSVFDNQTGASYLSEVKKDFFNNPIASANILLNYGVEQANCLAWKREGQMDLIRDIYNSLEELALYPDFESYYKAYQEQLGINKESK